MIQAMGRTAVGKSLQVHRQIRTVQGILVMGMGSQTGASSCARGCRKRQPASMPEQRA